MEWADIGNVSLPMSAHSRMVCRYISTNRQQIGIMPTELHNEQDNWVLNIPTTNMIAFYQEVGTLWQQVGHEHQEDVLYYP